MHSQRERILVVLEIVIIPLYIVPFARFRSSFWCLQFCNRDTSVLMREWQSMAPPPSFTLTVGRAARCVCVFVEQELCAFSGTAGQDH